MRLKHETNIMKRRQFIKGPIALSLASGLKALESHAGEVTMERMPTLFLGHGDPTNVIQRNQFSNAWDQVGQKLPKPKAILMVSAHWETPEIEVAVTRKPPMIYDFYGFPDVMYELDYPAPGSPEMARKSAQLLS